MPTEQLKQGANLSATLSLKVTFGDRRVWINCLSGFAWRAWLLLYCLPAWFTALRITAAS